MKTQSRRHRVRTVPLVLAIHFICWWGVAAYLWTTVFHSPRAAAVAPFAPVYLGVWYLSVGEWESGTAGLVGAGLFVAAIALGLRNQILWMVVLAHLATVLYWGLSFLIIGTGY